MERSFVKYCLWIVVVLCLMKESDGCLEGERLGLLELKAFLSSNSSSDYDNLQSWADDTEADCCVWERVKCNHTTKHVMDLLLGDVTYGTDVWLLNFSYFAPFKQLIRLDLSADNFEGWVDIEGMLITTKLSVCNKLSYLEI